MASTVSMASSQLLVQALVLRLGEVRLAGLPARGNQRKPIAIQGHCLEFLTGS
jgi:hypothetical protein